ncbi:MAG: methylmalonyl-CoA mutase family protein [Planctomycetota bacterium]
MTFPAADQRAWRQRVEAELAGEGFERSLVTRTLEGLLIQPLYGPDDRPKMDLGVSGSSPFVRGGRPANGQRWRIAAEIGAADPAVAATEVQEALGLGADALHLSLDRAGRLGFAHHTASNMVGVGGTALVDRQDFAEVLAGVDLERTPVALDAGANALPAAALFVSELWARDLPSPRSRGHLGADVHAALATDGALPGDLADARRELVDLTVYSRMHFEHLRALAVDARPWQRAGGHAVQELGLALAGFVETLRWLESELPPAAAAGELVFRIDVGQDLLTEVAKLRALRLLYAKVMSAASVPVPPAPVIHAFSSQRMLTSRDAETNLLRVTLSAFAAASGGADWITTSAFDAELAGRSAQREGAGPSRALARRLALTTQLVLAEECHLGHVTDPFGGAYAIEARTVELARGAFALMQDIERRGGLAACLTDGYVTDLLGASHAARATAVAARARPITGVSEFPLAGERFGAGAAADTSLASARARTAARQEERTRTRGRMVLGDLTSVEHAILAAERGATLAELGGALVRGVPLERAPLLKQRDAAPFEALRDAADLAAAAQGAPRVLLACLGDLAAHAPRASFAQNLFVAGGFDVVQGEGTGAQPPAAAAAALVAQLERSTARVVCLCGSDAAYTTHATAAISALHAAGARLVLYAGRPRHTEHEAELRDAGVGRFVHAGCDAVAALTAALHAAGVDVAACAQGATQ